MRKMTILEIVQEVLSDSSSDEVNSINDSFESQQAASLVRTVYRNMMSNRDWPHTKRAVKIVPYSDNSMPTHMRIQDEIKELILVNYNKSGKDDERRRYAQVRFVEPDEFLRMTNSLDNTREDIDVIIDPSGVELLIQNSKQPTYFTSFDDDTLVFNSYDKTVDDSLQASKVQAYAYIIPSVELTDDFVLDLPVEAFAALLSEVKSHFSVKVLQQVSAKDEQDARRQNAWLANKKWRSHTPDLYPNYGRRGFK